MKSNYIASTLLCTLLSAVSVFAADKGKDYADQDLARRDFSGKNLEKANFENADLQEANFTGASAAGANMKAANLDHAVLSKADFSKADFRKCKFQYPSSWDTDFSGANFEGVDLTQSLFGRVRLRNANLRNIKGIRAVSDSDFRGADLRGANLTEYKEGTAVASKFRGAFYDRATRWPKGFDPEEAECILVKPDNEPDRSSKPPREGTPKGKDFRDQDFIKANLAKKDFEKADLEGVDLIEAKMAEIKAAGANFYAADISGADLTKADLSGADMRHCRMRFPTLNDTNFSNANFEEFDFLNTNCNSVNLTGANLKNARNIKFLGKANLSDADVRGADFSALPISYFREIKLKGTKFSKKTKWPDGFDPQAAGAVMTAE